MKPMYQVQNFAGLSKEQIMDRCPAVYAPHPYEGVSEKYLYISTGDILNQLAEVGFVPTMAAQQGAKAADRTSFAMHMLRLRQRQDIGSMAPEIVEFLLYNSCDCSRSFRVIAGIFRAVCSNGLVSGTIAGRLTARHVGINSITIVESTLALASTSGQILSDVEEMKHTFLTHTEQFKLSQYALSLRFGEKAHRYQPQDLLAADRREDEGDDLWTVFNRIQGHVIGGGLRHRGRRSRPIQGIAQNYDINQRLADSVAELLASKRRYSQFLANRTVEGSIA